jgi:hypothetical protein
VLCTSQHQGRRFLVENLRSVEPVVPTAVGRGCRAVGPDILCVEKVSHLKIPGELDGERLCRSCRRSVPPLHKPPVRFLTALPCFYARLKSRTPHSRAECDDSSSREVCNLNPTHSPSTRSQIHPALTKLVFCISDRRGSVKRTLCLKVVSYT